jgi:hypothetical protein
LTVEVNWGKEGCVGHCRSKERRKMAWWRLGVWKLEWCRRGTRENQWPRCERVGDVTLLF